MRATNALVRRDRELEATAVRIEAHVLAAPDLRPAAQLNGLVMEHAICPAAWAPRCEQSEREPRPPRGETTRQGMARGAWLDIRFFW